MRILIVEDDERIAEPVAEALRGQRHTVDVANDGAAGLELSAADAHDVVVLDLMLPGIGGLEICRTMRSRGSQAMVLMMTARDSVRDKVVALDEGADDYVVKPFELAELLARVRALSRRGSAARSAIVRHGPLELDQPSAQIKCCGNLLTLTRTEYKVLEVMLLHPTRVFSCEQLYERSGGLDGQGGPASIKSHMANLRKKLRAAGSKHDAIVTVYGFGYRLRDA